MEHKFLFLAVLALFAAFGTIETRRYSHTRSSSGKNVTSWSHGRNNGSWALRPFGTVPPPTNHGRHNASWPWRPFGTVPPPTNHGRHNGSSPWRPFGTVPPPTNHGIWFSRPHRWRSLDEPSGLNYSHYSQRDSNNTGTIQPSNNATTGLYPSLSGLVEAQDNGVGGGNLGTVLNVTGRPFAPDYHGNSSSWSGHYFQNQTDPRISQGAQNATTGGAFQNVVNGTASHFVPVYNQGNSSAQSNQSLSNATNNYQIIN